MAKRSNSTKLSSTKPVSLSDLADFCFDERGNLILHDESLGCSDETDDENNNASHLFGTGQMDEDDNENDSDEDKELDIEVTSEGLADLAVKGAFIFYRCRVCEALDVGKMIYAGGTYNLNLVRSHYHILPFQPKPKLVILDVYLSRECMAEAVGENVRLTSNYQSIELRRCPRLRRE